MTDIIYESDTVTIYVAEHIFMSAKRVIKKILKKSIRQDSFYSEVKVLRNLRHPNIPIIYDTMEDSFAYYIIEEYIAGETLEAFISKTGILSEEKIADIGIKLCRVVSYLHCQKPIPVLFLDIHPKNILISQDEIFLVDFGSSYYEGEARKREWLLGTVGYAAPEQYSRNSLDVRADIYGIGAVLHFLITGRSEIEDALSLKFPKHISEKMKMIVTQCMAKDRNFRFKSVDLLLANLMELKLSDNVRVNNEKPHIISFKGAFGRAGVTHISLGLAKYMADKGYRVVYEEANESNHLRMIAKYDKLAFDSGFFRCGRLLLKPVYGPQIQLQVDCDFIIRDEGVYSDANYTEECNVLVVCGKPWELEKSMTLAQKVNAKLVLCNGETASVSGQLWTSLRQTRLSVPVLGEPLKRCEGNEEFYGRLAEALGLHTNGGEVHKRKARLFERITRKK